MDIVLSKKAALREGAKKRVVDVVWLKTSYRDAAAPWKLEAEKEAAAEALAVATIRVFRAMIIRMHRQHALRSAFHHRSHQRRQASIPGSNVTRPTLRLSRWLC